MAVRIRLKRGGRKHRPYFRICIMDSREPRDGKSIEEVGTYDPMIRDTDKRVTMKASRVDYWLGVGALPTENVKILIDKYKGKVPETRIETRKVPAFVERLSAERKSADAAPTAPPPAPAPAPAAEAPPEAAQ